MVFLVALVTMPVFAFATVTGLRSADPAARELLASVDASRWEVLWRLRLPVGAAVDPRRRRATSSASALAAAYYGEGGNLANDGLGAIGAGPPPTPRTGRCCGPPCWRRSLLGVIGLAAVTLLERLLVRWHASQRRWARGR